MPFKYDAQGQIVTADHNGTKLPVFIHPDGKEAPFDAESTLTAIAARAQQSQRVEGENKDMKALVAKFDGLDPVKAREAIDKMSTVDLSKMVHAGEVDKVKAEVAKAVEAQYAPFKTKAEQLQQQLEAHLIGAAFSGSQFVATKIAAADAASAAQIARGLFGQNLKVEDGKVVAYDGNGNKIYSKTRPGELADPNEAIEALITGSPLATSILKGSGASGGGAGGGGGGGGGGKQQITRAQFGQLSPAEQRAKATDPKVEIVD